MNELTPPRLRTTRRRLVPQSEVTKTPNVPRVKGSFFNRKHREITGYQGMSPGSAEGQVTTPMLNRRRSYMYTSPVARAAGQDNGSSSTRSSRTKVIRSDTTLSSDYTTPRTTRTFVETINSGGNKSSKKLAHLIYQPLQLDTESSSESSDSFMRRRKVARPGSPNKTPSAPLAIEAPPPPVSISEDANLPDSKTDESDSNDNDKNTTAKETAKHNDEPEVSNVTQCITPPITPPKVKGAKQDDEEVKESKLKPSELPDFIPGRCDIEEVLRIYKSATNKV